MTKAWRSTNAALTPRFLSIPVLSMKSPSLHLKLLDSSRKIVLLSSRMASAPCRALLETMSARRTPTENDARGFERQI